MVSKVNFNSIRMKKKNRLLVASDPIDLSPRTTPSALQNVDRERVEGINSESFVSSTDSLI